MEREGESGAAWIDARGIHPPDSYAIRELPAPPGYVLLALAGEVDIAAAPELRERLANAAAERPRGVVLDMSELTFADSSALRELLRADGDLAAIGGTLVLASLPATFLRVLELTRAHDLLRVARSVEAAFEQLGA
jgi:anti-anti-sigma factor